MELYEIVISCLLVAFACGAYLYAIRDFDPLMTPPFGIIGPMMAVLGIALSAWVLLTVFVLWIISR